MIDPTEKRPFFPATISPVALHALLLYVNNDGNPTPDPEGYFGEILEVGATQVSEGTLWIVNDAPHQGLVVQAFTRYDGTKLFDGSVPLRYEADGMLPDEVSLVVTAFAAGILGAKRGKDRGAGRLITDISALRQMDAMGDEMLQFALMEDLRSAASLAEHVARCDEIETYIRSGGEMAEEIRALYRKIRNPRDIKKRYNVYRLVLMLRAAQRRSKAIADGKQDTLDDILFSSASIEAYVSDVVALASRLGSVLGDNQPWWLGIEDGKLPKGTGSALALKFSERLRGYNAKLKAIGANPFRSWAAIASNEIQTMIDGLESRRYERVPEHARCAITALRAIVLREQLSTALQLVTRSGEIGRVDTLGANLEAWVRDHAFRLDRSDTVLALSDAIRGVDSDNNGVEVDLRNAERIFDAIPS